MRGHRLVIAMSAVGVAAVGAVAPAQAGPTAVLARWEMNEPPAATVMVDSSGNGLNGVVGSEVVTGATYDGAVGYRFGFLRPNTPPPHPEHLVRIDDARLNPGDQDYRITFRYRTTHSFGNIMQKGQSGQLGGNWKIQQPKGYVSCLFDGSIQRRAVKSNTPTNDGAWHTITCERTAAGVTITVDGVAKKINGPTGTIANVIPMTIGGKLNCDQVDITCDYFSGDIDYVLIEVGASSS